MTLDDFDYDLPPNLIAQYPVEQRDRSRLLVLNRKTGSTEDRIFSDILNYLKPGDLLVVNNSKVFPARLIGFKSTGGEAEIFLNHEIKPGEWEVLGRRVKVGQTIYFKNSVLEAAIIEKRDESYIVKFNLPSEQFFAEIEKIGLTPLPPYIKRENQVRSDKNRYQTVYAKDRGSAAAPTAGLHFTPELLAKVRQKGIVILEVTLHVGLGTFAPIKVEDVLAHTMHSEYYRVKKEIVVEILKAKKEGRKVFAVGTTTTRVLEHLFKTFDFESMDLILPGEIAGWTNIFIYPGFKFRCVDAIITNFHLPKSTLLMLVSAFAGQENVLNAYHQAVSKRYRFFSYGDAMLIV